MRPDRAPGARVVGQRGGDVGFTSHQASMRSGTRPEAGPLRQIMCIFQHAVFSFLMNFRTNSIDFLFSNQIYMKGSWRNLIRIVARCAVQKVVPAYACHVDIYMSM